MLLFAATAAVILACVAASEAPRNATSAMFEANAAIHSWNDAGIQLQLALATVDARVLVLASERFFLIHILRPFNSSSHLQLLPLC
jgi:hypothetical protein